MLNRFGLLVAIALILVLGTYFGIHLLSSKEQAIIKKVIDGDTVILENGKVVRLLGIDAPERGQFYFEEAKEKLKELIEGKEVILEKDLKNSDKYGRLLRWIWLNGTNINIEMVKFGYAKSFLIEDLKYKEEILNAENKAKNNKAGIWSFLLENKTCDNRCIGLSYLNYNAPGNDCSNPNGEYVKLKNFCDWDCNLTNWTIKDKANNTFVFPKFILMAGESVIIYSGCGENGENKLYWCPNKKCKAIWDNKGDIFYLFNSNGEMVLRYSYSS